MKKLTLLLAAALTFGLLATNVAADTCSSNALSGFYVGLKASFNYTSKEKTSAKNLSSGYRRYFNDSSDKAFGGALAVGYNFDKAFDLPMRAELEYGIYTGVKTKKEDVLGSGYGFMGKQKFNIQTLFVNFYYDFKTGTAVTPYISSGLGLAFIDTKLNSYDPYGGYLSKDSSRKLRTNLALNLSIGAAYDITENVALIGGYRFMSLGSAKTANGFNIAGNYNMKTQNIFIHQFYLGVNFAL